MGLDTAALGVCPAVYQFSREVRQQGQELAPVRGLGQRLGDRLAQRSARPHQRSFAGQGFLVIGLGREGLQFLLFFLFVL